MFLSFCLCLFVYYQISHKLDPIISISCCRHIEPCQVQIELHFSIIKSLRNATVLRSLGTAVERYGVVSMAL
jgi:hypothetical protein